MFEWINSVVTVRLLFLFKWNLSSVHEEYSEYIFTKALKHNLVTDADSSLDIKCLPRGFCSSKSTLGLLTVIHCEKSQRSDHKWKILIKPKPVILTRHSYKST